MTIYDYVMQFVDSKYIKVNLSTKTLHVGKKCIIKKGKVVCEELKEMELITPTKENPMEVVFKLWLYYYYSIDTKQSKGKHTYFANCPFEDLPEWALMAYNKRHVTQAKLELYILLASMSGNLTWVYDGWFYQHSERKEFVVLRKWVNME